MKARIFTLVLLLFASICTAQNLTGSWNGEIKLPGTSLKFSIKFQRADGGWSGSMDIPQQNAQGLQVTNIALDGLQLKFSMPDVPGNASFSGTLNPEFTSAKGSFTQMGQTFPMEFAKKTEANAASDALSLEEKQKKFSAQVDSLLKKGRSPGLGVVVLHEGQTAISRGFGMRNLKENLPVDENTLFAIGSCTKAFTAMCAAMLVDEGKLDWDEPIKTYLPSFNMHDPIAAENLNMVDALSHRSGLPRHDLVWYGSTATREEMVAKLAHLQPSAGFRAKWQYQNLMFMLAGYVAGKINGSTWEEMVQKRIFDPLGMSQANFRVADLRNHPNAAKGYQWEKLDQKYKELPYREIDAVGPAGCINASVADMTKWLKLLLAGGKWDGKTLVSKSNFSKMTSWVMPIGRPQPYSELSEIGYGLGWMTYQYKGLKVVDHGGAIDGFKAHVFFIPESQFGVVVLSNGDGSPLPNLVSMIAADIFLGLGETDWPAKIGLGAVADESASTLSTASKAIAGTKPSHALSDYVGTYQDLGYGQVEITLAADGKQLEVHFGTEKIALTHRHYDVFTAKNGLTGQPFLLNFITDAAGEISRFETVLEMSVDAIVFKKQAPAKLSDINFLRTVAGKYKLANGTEFRIEERAGRLYTILPGQPEYQLEPWRKLEYKINTLSGYSLEVVLSAAGKAEKIIFHQPEGDYPATRVEDPELPHSPKN